MSDALAVDLEDAELSEEIGLLSALMVAAQAADRPLSQTQVDQVLAGEEIRST